MIKPIELPEGTYRLSIPNQQIKARWEWAGQARELADRYNLIEVKGPIVVQRMPNRKKRKG